MTIMSAAEFIHLRTSDDPAEYRRAAEEDAPVRVWLELIEHHPDMRGWVAHNKTVPVEVLERLALDDDPQVRSAVAMKRKTSHVILSQLASDSDDAVRLHVAQHRNTPRAVLRTLAHDDWDRVREAAFANLD